MGFVRDITGRTAADAAKEAGKTQALGAQEASQLFNPLAFGSGAGGNASAISDLDAQISKLQGFAGGDRGGLLSSIAGAGAFDSRLQDLIAQRDTLIAEDAGRTPGLGQQGIEQAGFLTDPQAQFDFLQNNPLFQEALANANQQTLGLAASRGRVSAGDTLTDLSRNTLLAASPLIQQQKGSILDLLGFGERSAVAQGNLRTGQAAALAGGQVGSANARTAGAQNLLDIGATAAAAFSDDNLKENIVKIGTENGFDIFRWDWNETAFDKFLLAGEDKGVLASHVQKVMPEAITYQDGYRKVNYEMIGVVH